MELPSLPFVIPHLFEGLATARGMARVTRAGLILEFVVKDSLVGVLKTGVREVHIPIDDLHQLDLRKGWFRTRLLIRTRRMALLEKIPGNQAGTIELRVDRRDRASAQALVSVLRLRQSERELEKIGSDHGVPV